jgi:Chemotaxis signal transduction protein
MIQQSDAEILFARARVLASARVASSSALDLTGDRYLVVLSGTDRFLIALESVVEVFRPSNVTPLPRSIAPLWGLTSWRGSILPVIAISPSLPAQRAGVVVIVATGTRVIAGLWAHEVEAEIAVAKNEIHAPPTATGVRELLVSGVTSDAKSVLSADSLARLLDERTKSENRTALNNSTGIKV